jgi:hypothetical protein
VNLYTHEVINRGKHQDLLAEAAAARLAKLALEHNPRFTWMWPQAIEDVLQKVSLKFVRIYHLLYRKSKSHVSPQ